MSAPEDLAQLQLRRLETLIEWAIDFVERQTDEMERCFRHPNGEIHPADVAVDVADAHKWLEQARKAIK
jgi:hypothetical protein